MLPNLTNYLLSITSEEESTKLVDALVNLTGVYMDASVELGITDIVSTLDNYTTFENKDRIYQFIRDKQVSSLQGCGIRLINPDDYDLSAVDIIIRLLVDLENYEYKDDIIYIIANGSDNVDILISIIDEIYCPDVIEVYETIIDNVDDEFFNQVEHYLSDEVDNLFKEEDLNLQRLSLFKKIINNNPDKNFIAINYLKDGFQTNIDYGEIINLASEDLSQLNDNVKLELYLLYLLSNSDSNTAKEVLNQWSTINIDNRSVLIEIDEINFEAEYE